MRKIIKTAISLLLVLCLLCGIMSYTVLAEESKSSSNLEDLIAGAVSVEDIYGNLDSSTVPEIIGYENAVSRAHVRRLYDEEGTDLNRVVFLNADGTQTIYVFDFPVKYIENGKINDITLDIADGSEDGQFETAKGISTVTFPKNISDGIKLAGNDITLYLVPKIPEKVSNKTISNCSQDVSVSTSKRIDKHTISYNYDKKTSIEYSLTYTGFKEDIVVEEYTGQTEYDFVLYTEGLRLSEIDDSFYLVDESNVIKATIGDIIIFSADEKNNAMGEIHVQTIVEQQEYLLTISVDSEYLADENTAYPIRIDPSVEICYNNNGAGAISDVTINSGAGSGASSGSLYVGSRNSYGISRILMKFPGLDMNSLGNNIIITNAAVEIRDLLCESEGIDISCYVFSGNVWDESTVSWGNVSPNSISTFLSSNTVSYAYGIQQVSAHRYSFDITKAVEGWRIGNYNPDKGIIFKSSSAVENSSTKSNKTFASYNRSSNKPSLSITYSNAETLLENDVYYLNNLYCGDYIHYVSSSADAVSGLISDLGNSIRWVIKNVNGGYVIQPKSATNKYLAVSSDTSSTSVSIETVSDTSIPERCIWDIRVSSVGGCLIKNTYNSKYLFSYGNSVSTSSNTGSSGTTLYDSRVWRIVSITYYGNDSSGSRRELTSFSQFPNYELEVGQSRYFYINRYYSNEMWCSSSKDFRYSVSSTAKLTVSSGKLNAVGRGVVTVTATHKITNRVMTFEVFVKNSLLSESDISQLYTDFNALLGDGYAYVPLYNISSVSDVVRDIVENDQVITDFCNQYRIPKEFVQSVLFREIWCYNSADTIADSAVQEYYAWMEGTGNQPLLVKTDSSTGIGQICASTAINALNHADDRGLINLSTQYNGSDWHDVWNVWKNLHNSISYNINCCALVILDCQYEFEAVVPYEDFFDFTEVQIKKILSRYNGTNSSATEYGNICFEYFEIFESINE